MIVGLVLHHDVVLIAVAVVDDLTVVVGAVVVGLGSVV